MAATLLAGCTSKDPVGIVIEMEDGGIIEAELYPDVAPKTVENFLKLVDEDFYAGLVFHRVIPGFMIQGGGMDKDLKEKPAEAIYGEFTNNGFKNDLLHERGVLSMARTMEPDSASSQFFIIHEKADWLDGDYAAFGKVTKGLDVVDKIADVETDDMDCPVELPVIKTIRRK
ncbi:MAG: peptidylprolyl isomerase [Eubacteriales bacterium]|nr:peptidylprolyl isomerase [Eubacteriales bacterium]